jgi:ABC-type dipeptide/oligopeptide/nickel transport system ATPase component
MAQAGEAQWRTVRGRQIALVPQDPTSALNPTLTIERQCWLMQRHARNRAEARRHSAECLAQVGLGDPESFLPRYPFQLSGGQRQRVLIAAALLHGAGLIIADEPTTALDVTVQAEILTLLKGLTRDSGLGMIFITHSLGVAAQLCDEVLVLRQGQVVERGPAAALLSNPGAQYTQALLAAMPGASAPRRKLPVESERP